MLRHVRVNSKADITRRDWSFSFGPKADLLNDVDEMRKRDDVPYEILIHIMTVRFDGP